MDEISSPRSTRIAARTTVTPHVGASTPRQLVFSLDPLASADSSDCVLISNRTERPDDQSIARKLVGG